MKLLRAPLMAGLLAAGLLAAGCGGDPWPAGSVPATSPPADPVPSTSTAPPESSDGEAPGEPTGSVEPSGSGDGGDGGSGGSGDSGATGENPAAGDPAARRCADGDLNAALGGTTAGSGQRRTTVVWTNTSPEPCTMTGFGGVDLRGPDHSTHGPSYSLPRSAGPATLVQLRSGGTAHTVITWLSGGDWKPTRIVITPPDETTPKTLEWPGTAVQRQDGATRPGTYLGPVSAGSEPGTPG